MGLAILAAILIAVGGILHFVGLRIAIEARPDIARAMGGVLTQAEQDKIEKAYQEKLQLIQENLQTTSEELLQIQKMKDRFMEMATPSAVKSQIPGGNSKGGPLKPANLKSSNGSDLIESLDESLQSVTVFKKNIQEVNQLWSKQLAWLGTLPTGLPVKGGYSLSSGYGLRIDPFTQMMARHEGLDFSATVGTPIIASAGGVVSRAGYEAHYGNMVEIKHAEGFMTRYAHASQLLVRTGQTVKRGDVIAKVGNTGRSSGPHLHYEVMRAGAHINPINMIP
jgi:murein DD-endopeptidase MepM/ murein hydrolase activator NlpD